LNLELCFSLFTFYLLSDLRKLRGFVKRSTLPIILT